MQKLVPQAPWMPGCGMSRESRHFEAAEESLPCGDTRFMRAVDLAHLSKPYPESSEPTEQDARSAIGVRLPNWSSLKSDVFEDFVDGPPYGVGWWAPDPGTSRRILIADQLYCCLSSVPYNMAEAALHWLEFLDMSEQDSARLAYAIQMLPSGPVIDPPPARSILEQLLPDLVRMHQAGAVRAVASALDCLAGVVIGVAALEENILTAGFKKVRKSLSGIAKKAQKDGAANSGLEMQAKLARRLEEAIGAAGPKGWLDWVLEMRNMLVHRGRRIERGQYLPIEPVLFGPDGRPAQRARRVGHLPRDPGRSDIEVLLGTPCNLVLHEEGAHTLRGIIISTIALLETVAVELLDLWRWRRASPRELRQPAQQWQKGASTQTTGFDGYAPGSLPFGPALAIMNPAEERRFRAASVFDGSRDQWVYFD